MSGFRVVACAFALFLAVAASAAAQDVIASDRPGIGSGATVLGAGILQVEAGTSLSGAPGVSGAAVGETLVRFGLGAVEGEFFGPSLLLQRPDGADRDTGLADFGIGVKVPVGDALGGIAKLSLQAKLTSPTGSDAFTSDEWVPALNALFDVSLGGSAGLGLNVGYQRGPGDDVDALQLIVTPGLSVGDGWGVFAGWAGSWSAGEDVHWAEGGFTRVLGRDVQLDANGGWAPDGDQWFVGVGVAVRTGAG